jgi:Asp-tRNA(Asn)/Glu-tRNA(Gln) amidotransferase B subunit
MRFLPHMILALVALYYSALAQEPESAAVPKVASTQAASAPPTTLEADANGTVPPEQIRALLRKAETNDLENNKRVRDYTYIEREEQHKLDTHGRVKKVESTTLEILQIYGEQVERRIKKDDNPLPAPEARKEEEKLQKIIDKSKNESEDDRRKRLEKEEKAREEDRKFVFEVADAFNFRLVGSEVVDGFDTWVLDAEPRPAYQPKQRASKMLTKFKGRLWIDKREAQLVKLDITAIDTLTFGFIVARIHKGMHVVLELAKINDEVWLPKHVAVHVDVRVALFKNIDEDVDVTFRDYKKFRTNTKITVVGEESRE